MKLLLIAAAGYALGSIPAGYLLVRFLRGVDIRREGSGNIGATNVLRTTGWAAGIATLLFDLAKGAAAVLAAKQARVAPIGLAEGIAMLAVVAGHVFPLTLRFRGGKGVACAVGASLVISPIASGASLAVLAAVVTFTRWVSLGSIVFAVVFPALLLMMEGALPTLPCVSAACLLILARHGGNIARLLAGTEPKLGSR